MSEVVQFQWKRFADERPRSNRATVHVLIIPEGSSLIHSGWYAVEDNEYFYTENFQKPKDGDLWCYQDELLPAPFKFVVRSDG